MSTWRVSRAVEGARSRLTLHVGKMTRHAAEGTLQLPGDLDIFITLLDEVCDAVEQETP